MSENLHFIGTIAYKSHTVPKEVEASYAAIIDAILATSDLNTVSEKRIRKGLQASVEYDITPQKVRPDFVVSAALILTDWRI